MNLLWEIFFYAVVLFAIARNGLMVINYSVHLVTLSKPNDIKTFFKPEVAIGFGIQGGWWWVGDESDSLTCYSKSVFVH